MLSRLPWTLSEDLKKNTSLAVRLIFQSHCLGGSHVDQDTVYLKTYSTLTNSGKTVILCWIPGHVGMLETRELIGLQNLPCHFLYLLLRCQSRTSSHAPNYLCAENGKKYGIAVMVTSFTRPPKPNLQPPRGGGGNDWWNRFHPACGTSIDSWHTSRQM